MRKGSKKVLFVVITGKSRTSTRPRKYAEKLMKKGVEIFGLALGPRKNAFDQLEGLVSSPVKKHVFWLKRRKDTSSLCKMLSGKGEFFLIVSYIYKIFII